MILKETPYMRFHLITEAVLKRNMKNIYIIHNFIFFIMVCWNICGILSSDIFANKQMDTFYRIL